MAARGLTTLEYASGLRRNVTRLEAALADAEKRESELLRRHGRNPVIRLRGLCVYCGHGPTRGTPATCHGHADLPAIDAYYGAAL